jgi:hypothetical protein
LLTISTEYYLNKVALSHSSLERLKWMPFKFTIV